MTEKRTRAEILARSLLTAGALLPYFPLLKLSTIYVTDDYFASDIFHGELPFRVLVAEALKQGDMPVWTDKLCSGTPLGISGEPIGLLSFALLPTAAALDVFLLAMLLVAAHGTYGFARRIGASRTGSVLAGIAFAGSGFLACQLKHLAIVSTVVWLPVGLTLLDMALSQERVPRMVVADADSTAAEPPSAAHRALWLLLFGLVFAEQILAGFPQSAYICGLTYGAFAMFRAITLRGTSHRIPRGVLWLAAAGAVVALAVLAGANVLLPLSEYATATNRGSLGFDWTIKVPYWPRNALTFLIPYINGDVSDDTYHGDSLFWEDYGYVGAATFLLALYGAVRERRRSHVVFLAVMTVVAYLLVLGPNTPVYRLAWASLPGLKMFRLPTRFLFVVDFGLAVLGSVGLSRLGIDLRRWLERTAPRVPQWLVVGLCVGTALDLFIHQPRQNPMVPANEWLAPPEMAKFLRSEGEDVRTLTLGHKELHKRVTRLAHGWADLEPHYLFRESLQPNTGAYWGIASADCYNAVSPPWVTCAWGDQNTPGLLLARALQPLAEGAKPPPLSRMLATLGVTHVISPLELRVRGLTRVASGEVMNLYRVEDSRRLRFAEHARRVASDSEAAELMLAQSFSPDVEVLVHDPPPTFELHTSVTGTPGQAVVVHRSSREVLIEATAPPAGAYLFLAETYYREWVAEVDGNPTPVARANITGRAVWVPPGVHKVKYSFQAGPSTRRALWITVASLIALLSAAAVAGYLSRREARRGSPPERS